MIPVIGGSWCLFSFSVYKTTGLKEFDSSLDLMAEAVSLGEWEEGFEDEFGEIIKTRSGRRNYLLFT